MAISLEQFVKQLTESGLIAAETLKDFLPPIAFPTGAEELAKELLRQKKLTKFQIEQISRGHGQALLLGNYVLMEKIGAGGMGQVFKAHHRRMDRLVAVKLLPSAMTRDKAAIARFEREAKAVARISHPNIVAAYDADQSNGVHFLVMEFIQGSDLAQLIKKGGPFSVEKAIACVLQVARGLEAAHAAGLIHRDIKPANLLMDAAGTVKILDMGLARLDQPETAALSELTDTGSVMGTVDFMAPEQAIDSKAADARADIYSLGCVLHYLLTARTPYEGTSLMNRLLAHREQPIPTLRSSRPDVSEGLDALFKKMLAKTVGDRYQSMSEVRLDLERIEADQVCDSHADQLNTLSLSPVDTRERPSGSDDDSLLLKSASSGRRHRRVLSAVPTIAVVSMAVVIVAGLFKFTNETLTETRDSRPSEIATEPHSVVEGREPLAFQKPGFEEWVKRVVGLPAEKQLDEVSKKLVELNPGFDGKLFGWGRQGPPGIENGKVIGLEFSTEEVTDISPVQVFVGLRDLSIRCLSFGAGRVRDLSPIKGMNHIEMLDCSDNRELSDLTPLVGMPLRVLICERTSIGDLSPLREMKLLELNCTGTEVDDLSPLRGMPLDRLRCCGSRVSTLAPLREMKLTTLAICETSVSDLLPIQKMPLAEFNCQATQVSDISPLESMPLVYLNISNTKVSNLSPLRGIKLVELHCSRMPVTDLTALEGMKLKSLTCGGTRVADLSPLKGMPLAVFRCNGSAVTSLSALEGMPLVALEFSETEVSDLSPLRQMPLKELLFWNTKVSNLSVLKGMPLERLEFALTPVSDLSPLADLKLERLIFGDTRVKDLSPLRGMPLKFIGCNTAFVTDLSPLQGMPLTEICFYPQHISEGLDLVRRMDSIKAIHPFGRGIWSTEEFWKKYDAGEFAEKTFAFEQPDFVQWMKAVAELPAERQLDEVRKKLVDLNPKFDGRFDHSRIENDVVTELYFTTHSVKDISPIRALKHLKHLGCDGTGEIQGILSSLAPLKGMDLTKIHCAFTEVSDLSPLAGMRLTEFVCDGTKVMDLSSLQQMPLEYLAFCWTEVSDLSPLQGMTLSQLHCHHTSIHDLSPLREMRSLTRLHVEATKISELSQLQGLPLSFLSIAHTAVDNLRSLEGMPLSMEFNCSFTMVNDLSPLRGMKLERLICTGTQISSLSALRGMPLQVLWCENTKVVDLSPLKESPLRELRINFLRDRDTELLRSIATLELINGKSVAEFWEVSR